MFYEVFATLLFVLNERSGSRVGTISSHSHRLDFSSTPTVGNSTRHVYINTKDKIVDGDYSRRVMFHPTTKVSGLSHSRPFL